MAAKVYDYENLSINKKYELLNDVPSKTNAKCDVADCGRKFRDTKILKKHYETKHFGIPTNDVNRCSDCRNFFASEGDMARHNIRRFTIINESDQISSSVFCNSFGTDYYIQYYLMIPSCVQSVTLSRNFNQFFEQPSKKEIKVTDNIQKFIVSIGENSTIDLISSSVFYISIESNDHIHFYLLNASNVQSVSLRWSSNQFLAQTIKQDIKNLYSANLREVVVMGLAPLGCAPYNLWLYSGKNGECIKTINEMILEFNFTLRYMVSELNEELADATIIFFDAFEGSMDIIQNHHHSGSNMTDEACCGLGIYESWINFCPLKWHAKMPSTTSGGINFIRLML